MHKHLPSAVLPTIPNHKNALPKHSVEISWFFYHSDFLWNHFQEFWRYKNCHFITFRGSELWFFMIFRIFWGLIFSQSQTLELLKLQKIAFFEHLHPPKVISRKIWVIEKLWNFHTVPHNLNLTKKIDKKSHLPAD